ncbi:hypothetical protein OIE50_34150 [Streptomyces canus]|uniref:hypothetical protein n=1 Tax=Streptomyces canus TaxID=58343 RepID=UPI003252748C
MSTNVVLDADVKARAACAVQLRYRTLGGLRPTATGLGPTHDERPVAARIAVTARGGACGEDRSVAARGAVIGPSRRGLRRTARRGAHRGDGPWWRVR